MMDKPRIVSPFLRDATAYREFLYGLRLGSRTIPVGGEGCCPTCGNPLQDHPGNVVPFRSPRDDRGPTA